MSISRVNDVQKIIHLQIQPGDEIIHDSPPEIDGRATFEVRTGSLERAEDLAAACQHALRAFSPVEVKPPRGPAGATHGPWVVAITVTVGGVRSL